MVNVKKLSFLIIISFLLSLLSIKGLKAQNLNVKLIKSFDSSVTKVFVNGSTILVGTEGGLYYTTDNFKSLQKKNDGLTNLAISSIDFFNGKYYIGTNGGGLYFGSLIDSKWASLKNLVDCPTISSITHEGDKIYITSYCSGFFVSFNRGTSFLNLTKGLSSVRASAFVIGSDGYYLGTDEGLYYSKEMNESIVWAKVLSNVSVNCISQFNGKVLVGTNTGLYSGNINKFEKVNVVSGLPNIKNIDVYGNRIAVAVETLGVFFSCDGVNYFLSNSELFFDAFLFAFNAESKLLYVGTKSGKLYSIDLGEPILLFDKSINLGVLKKGAISNFSFLVYDFSFSTQELSIVGPNFSQITKSLQENKISVSVNLDLTKLSPQKYSIPFNLKKDSLEEKMYVNFEVVEGNLTTVKLYISSTTAYVNDKMYKLDAAPFIDAKSGRTLVPLRFISEALGFDVSWDGTKKEVTISDKTKSKIIKLYIGKTTAYVNDKSVLLDVAPVILPPGRTFVPIRFISETFNGSVFWDSRTKEVKIVF